VCLQRTRSSRPHPPCSCHYTPDSPPAFSVLSYPLLLNLSLTCHPTGHKQSRHPWHKGS
jgi:hypothetical protein